MRSVCYLLVSMTSAFDDEVEQTVSIEEYLKDVEEQELVFTFL